MPVFKQSPLIKKRQSSKQVIDKLQCQVAARQAECDALLEQHRQLSAQHTLLANICDALAWARQHLAADKGSDAEDAEELPQQPPEQQLSEPQLVPDSEQLLLQELSSLQCSSLEEAADALRTSFGGDGDSGCSRGAPGAVAWVQRRPAACCSLSEPQPIAPAHDPVVLFRTVAMGMPLLPGVEAMTLQQLQATCHATVREVALQLHLHQAWKATAVPGTSDDGSDTHTTPLQQLEAAIIRRMRMMSTLARLHRGDLVHALHVSNLDTGEVLSQANIARHRAAIEHIGLTPRQQERIAEGFLIFRHLLAPVLEEQKIKQQLLQQLQVAQQPEGSSAARAAASMCMRAGPAGLGGGAAAAEAPCVGSPSTGTAASSVGSGGDSSAGSLMAAAGSQELGAWERLWQQQDAITTRLRLLLDKDMNLKVAFTSVVLGVLSWEQLGQLFVLMSPFLPYPAVLARVVTEQLQQAKAQPAERARTRWVGARCCCPCSASCGAWAGTPAHAAAGGAAGAEALQQSEGRA